jgi:hypothetical protein
VLQTVHMMCTRGGLCEQGVVDDLALLSCYLSSIIHDFEHKGVNNDYLVRVARGRLGWAAGWLWAGGPSLSRAAGRGLCCGVGRWGAGAG